jgi:hypothetical protein
VPSEPLEDLFGNVGGALAKVATAMLKPRSKLIRRLDQATQASAHIMVNERGRQLQTQQHHEAVVVYGRLLSGVRGCGLACEVGFGAPCDGCI